MKSGLSAAEADRRRFRRLKHWLSPISFTPSDVSLLALARADLSHVCLELGNMDNAFEISAQAVAALEAGNGIFAERQKIYWERYRGYWKQVRLMERGND